MTHPEPDWSLLPGNPAAFFGLPPDFDRQALRRSYGQRIRQYKPETHPAEFQRIRAAYEALDAQARYGVASAAASLAFSAAAIWEAAARESVETPPARLDVRPVARAASSSAPAARLAEEPPGTAYRRLAQRSGKSPHDFYTLAVLSDVAGPDEPHSFLKWLLVGLKEHRDEPALGRLLQEHLRCDVATADLPKALLAASKVVNGDRFYFLTEAAWDRLLREVEFPLFRRALAACEANLHDYRVAAKLVFYAHILRAALWKADDAWLDEAFAAVESLGGEMDPELEHDWELATACREYRNVAERFAAGGGIRGRLDQALRAFCGQPPVEGARAIVACQYEIAHDAHGAMEAFPLGAEAWPQVAFLWHLASATIAADFGFDPPDLDADRLRKQTLRVLRDLREEIDPLGRRYMRFRLIAILSWLALLIAGPLVLVTGVVPLKYSWPLLACWPPAAVALHLCVLRPKVLEPWLLRCLQRTFRTLYRTTWRPRLFRHVHAMAVPAPVALQQLIAVAQDVGDDQWLGWLFEFLEEDAAFPIYAAAQRFVR